VTASPRTFSPLRRFLAPARAETQGFTPGLRFGTAIAGVLSFGAPTDRPRGLRENAEQKWTSGEIADMLIPS
jgi:hypothetical protein